MLCQECQKRPATVHLTKVINNQKSQLFLCEECASAYQEQWSEVFESNFSLNKFLASLLNYDSAMQSHLNATAGVCPQCGQTYSQFAQSGKLGCDLCYQTFLESITPLLRRVHGAQVHKGKIPRRAGGNLRLKKELQDLRLELQRLVQNEEFEKAAQVRDKIRDLEKQLGL